MMEDDFTKANTLAANLSDQAWRALAHAQRFKGLFPTRGGYANGQTRQRVHMRNTVLTLARKGLLAPNAKNAFMPTSMGVLVLAIIASKRAGPPLRGTTPPRFRQPHKPARLPYVD